MGIDELDEKSPVSPIADSELAEQNLPPDFDRSHDTALDFLQTRDATVNAGRHKDVAYSRRLRRKADFLVMPFLFVVYGVTFLDKVVLNYAQIMGLTPALRLKGNDYSNASSAFYIAAVVMAVPNIYLLQRLPVGRYLGISMTCWGICTACHAALNSYGGLIAVRVLSGIFESAVPSCLMLISSQYFTRSEQAVRFAVWYSGLGIAQILGGLISWAFQHVGQPPTSTTAAWRMMFVAVGVFTVLLGVALVFAIPDTPMSAWFLSEEEKVNLLEHVKGNQSGIENKHFQPKQLLESLTSAPIYFGLVVSLLEGLCAGCVTSYSATLIRSFGYNPKQSALLNMPTGAVQFVSILAAGILVRYFGRRWLVNFAFACGGILGNCLLSFYPHHEPAGSLAGLWVFQIVAGVLPVFWQWIMTNTAGHTKRTFVAAFMNAGFNIGNLIAPQTFRAEDAPQYYPAKITLVVGCCVLAALLLILSAYYTYCNRRRDSRSPRVEDEVSETKAYAGMTDKENLGFRYVT